MKTTGLCILFLLTGFIAAWQHAVSDQEALDASKALMQQLGGRLKSEMQAKGPAAAMQVCAVEALPITAEASKKQGLALSRVTDRPRNPKNAADAEDLKVLASMREDLKAQSLKKLYRSGNHVYTPLVIQPLCLNCHGETLLPDVKKALDRAYPDDKATGYQLNQLRGAIRISPTP
ncbi:MAG: DUF3365 domain-containing protein [Acidobacteriota bacterium]|nr:DUF3365 domain-containing protein [Acidobacteriota bacterium]